MPSLLINGVDIWYEEMGTGVPIALNSGGRGGMEAIRGLAERLATHYRVIIHDRRNCGASDVVISGELSEHEIWADDLHDLLTRLDAAPAYVGGGSNGSPISLLVAIRHPESVMGLLLWNVVGGPVSAQRLGYNYYEQFVEIAKREGMSGIAESEFFAERIQQNPSNRERLLAMDPQEFISVMLRWHAFFTAERPVVGATEAQLQAIQAPTAIIPGNDEVHPREVGENLHRILLNSELYEPIWSTQERDTQIGQDQAKFRDLGYERMASVYLPFLTRLEEAKVSKS